MISCIVDVMNSVCVMVKKKKEKVKFNLAEALSRVARPEWRLRLYSQEKLMSGEELKE